MAYQHVLAVVWGIIHDDGAETSLPWLAQPVSNKLLNTSQSAQSNRVGGKGKNWCTTAWWLETMCIEGMRVEAMYARACVQLR